MPRISRLNALRGFAALMVMMSHFSNSTGVFGKMFGEGGGQVGVMIFFLLSGFLMSALYIHKAPDQRNVLSFAAARVARVMPLYAVVVLVSYVCTAWLGLSGFYEMRSLTYAVAHLALLKGRDALWTIPVEMHFYLLFIAFWFFARRSGLAWVVLASTAVLLLLLGVDYIGLSLGGIPFRIKILKHLNFFLAGVCIGAAHARLRTVITYRNNAFAAVLLLIFLVYPHIGEKFGLGLGMWEDARVLLLLSFVFCVVLFVVDDGCRLLSNPVTDYLGEISYGMYLLHGPLLHYVVPLDLPVWARFCVFVAATLALASACYVVVERPSRSFIRGLAPRPVVPAAA